MFTTKQLLGAASIMMGTVCIVAYNDYSHKIRSTSHSTSTAIKHYLIFKGMKWYGEKARKNFDKDTEDAAKVNEQFLLKEILCKNANTVYGRDHQLSTVTSREDYVQKHKLTTYEHYLPYIEALIERNDSNQIISAPLRMIGETSGTSGSKKLLPTSSDISKIFFTQGISLVFNTMFRAIPGCDSLQKSLKLMITPSYTLTEHGVKIGPNSSSPDDAKRLMILYTTPECAYGIKSEREMLYIHALFALKDRNLGHIESNFVPNVLNLFTFIQSHRYQLVQDIRTGTLSKEINIEPSIRYQIEQEIRPDPERATELELAFRHNDDRFRATNIWPHLNLVLAVSTGPQFTLHDEKLRELYLSDSIPIYSPLYAATEGLIGVNTDIHGSSYTLIPRAMFYEFIPESNMEQKQPKTHFIDQVELGKTYEMVITTVSGLYRYRLGDVVKVTGVHNKSPKIEFQYRKGQLLSARGEKTTEVQLTNAIHELSQTVKACILDYSCIEYPHFENSMPRYYVYVEVADQCEQADSDMYSQKLDELLRKENQIYDLFREKDMLEPAQVYLVRQGCFDHIREKMIEQGSHPSQIKVPHVARDPVMIDVLKTSVVN